MNRGPRSRDIASWNIQLKCSPCPEPSSSNACERLRLGSPSQTVRVTLVQTRVWSAVTREHAKIAECCHYLSSGHRAGIKVCCFSALLCLPYYSTHPSVWACFSLRDMNRNIPMRWDTLSEINLRYPESRTYQTGLDLVSHCSISDYVFLFFPNGLGNSTGYHGTGIPKFHALGHVTRQGNSQHASASPGVAPSLQYSLMNFPTLPLS